MRSGEEGPPSRPRREQVAVRPPVPIRYPRPSLCALACLALRTAARDVLRATRDGVTGYLYDTAAGLLYAGERDAAATTIALADWIGGMRET